MKMLRGEVNARNISLAVLRSHPYYNLSLCDFHIDSFSDSCIKRWFNKEMHQSG